MKPREAGFNFLTSGFNFWNAGIIFLKPYTVFPYKIFFCSNFLNVKNLSEAPIQGFMMNNMKTQEREVMMLMRIYIFTNFPNVKNLSKAPIRDEQQDDAREREREK